MEMSERELNRKFRTMISSTTSKVKLLIRLKGFGELGRVDFKLTRKEYSWDRRSIIISDEDKTRLRKVSKEVINLWRHSIETFILDNTEYKMMDGNREVESFDNSYNSPTFSTYKFFLVGKDFTPPTDKWSKSSYRCAYSNLTFKHNEEYIDFTKPSISVNSDHNVNRGLNGLKTVNKFIKYLSENTRRNQDQVILGYNRSVRNSLVDSDIFKIDVDGFGLVFKSDRYGSFESSTVSIGGVHLGYMKQTIVLEFDDGCKFTNGEFHKKYRIEVDTITDFNTEDFKQVIDYFQVLKKHKLAMIEDLKKIKS
jgi:hypothetical protein